MKKIIIAFLSVLSSIYGSLTAQELSISQLSDGISNMDYVYDMHTTTEGTLLVATDHSLVSYNGFDFTSVELQHAHTSPLITAIEQAPNPKLVGHFKGFISSLPISEKVSATLKGKVVAIVGYESKHFVFDQGGNCYTLNDDYEIEGTKQVVNSGTVNQVFEHGSLFYFCTTQGLKVAQILADGNWSVSQHYFDGSRVSSVTIFEETLYAVVDNTIVRLKSSGETEPLLMPEINGEIKSVLATNERLVVGSTSGLYDYNLQGGLLLSGAKTDHESRPFSVTKLYLSPNGAIYVATYGHGLWALPSTTFYYLSNKQLGNQKINAINFMANNCMVVGGRNGLSFYQDGKILQEVPASINQLQEKLVSTIRNHPDGLVIGTEEDGVWLLDSELELTQLIKNISSVADIASDADGNMWISTSYEGLYTFENGRLKHYSASSNFSRNDLSRIALYDNQLWFVNGDDGFGYINLSDSSLIIPQDLPPVKLLDFGIDSNQEIWAATQGDGIMNYQGNSFSFIDLSDVLGNNYSNTLLVDNQNGLWLTGQQALLKWTPQNRVKATKLTLYFESTFRSNAAYHHSNTNWVYYGTEQGIIYFNASEETQFNTSSVNVLLDNQSGANNQWFLPFRESYKISFTNPDLIQNSFLEYSYFVTDSQDDWTLIDDNSFNLNDLDYGSYEVRLKAASESGIIYHMHTLKLEISKPYWLQPWFYLLILIILGIGIYLFISFKTKQLRKRNIQLKKLVALRTAEITQKNRKLEQFAYAVSHDLKNPVVNIIGLVEMLEKMQLFDEGKPKEVFGMLGTSSRQLDSLVKGLVELLKVRNVDLVLEDLHFENLFNEVRQAISLQIAKSNAEIRIDFSAAPVIHFNRTYLYSIIYNLTSNAVKYRNPEKQLHIKISTRREEKYIVFEIQDNGLGMDLENSGDQLFKMFKRFHDHVEGTGVGLHLINDMVESSGGYIDVKSKPREGTTFSIYLKSTP